MPQPTIAHMHIFKCAGTTFSWTLERCFEGKVLYVESRRPGQRLSWKKVVNSPCFNESVRAITSHLIDLPEYKSLAEITVSFVRDPIKRLYSAFLFARDRQGRFPSNTTFKDYIEHHRCSVVSNFMTRHLSPQSWSAPFKGRNGWEMRLDLINFSRSDFFIGSLERFDESMVLLEYELEKAGHSLDLAYPYRLNTRKSEEGAYADNEIPLNSAAWLEPAIEVDRILLEKVNRLLDIKKKECGDFADRLTKYKLRCLDLASDSKATAKIAVKPENEWNYFD